MLQWNGKFYIKIRNTFRVGIRISANCAITGAIFSLKMQRDGGGEIIELRAVLRRRVIVVRRMLQRAHIRGVSLARAYCIRK